MGFLGTIGKVVGGAAKGLVTGGPVGAVLGGIGSIIKPSPIQTPYSQPNMGGISIIPPVISGLLPGGSQGPNLPKSFPGSVPEPGIKGGLQRLLPGGQSGYTGAPPGYHVNKAYLRYLRANEMGRKAQNPFNEQRATNVVVRNRKMNPLNPRALMRANHRQVAAVRMMRRTLRGSGYVITRHRFGGKKTSRKR